MRPQDFTHETTIALNTLCVRLLGHDLEALRFRCRGSQVESTLHCGTGRGWRPTGPDALALNVWLDAVLPASGNVVDPDYEAPESGWLDDVLCSA
jgi:hypothetical protein